MEPCQFQAKSEISTWNYRHPKKHTQYLKLWPTIIWSKLFAFQICQTAGSVKKLKSWQNLLRVVELVQKSELAFQTKNSASQKLHQLKFIIQMHCSFMKIYIDIIEYFNFINLYSFQMQIMQLSELALVLFNFYILQTLKIRVSFVWGLDPIVLVVRNS